MTEHANTFLLLTILLLLTVLLVFAMKYYSATKQAQLRVSNEDDYRLMAENFSKSLADSTAGLVLVKNEISGFNLRIAALEKMLKEID